MRGELLLPGSQTYECARRPFIARFDAIKPQAVVRCAAPTDVVAALAFARHFGLETAVRSGGHDLAGRSSTSGGSGSVYPAFPDSELADWEFAYYGTHRSRLREIKGACDPDNHLRGTHTIPLP